MFEILEKTLLTAVGALSLSQRKTEELIGELKSRFNLSEEEGKAMVARLREAAVENQKKLEEIAQKEVRNACNRMGIVTGEEFEKLRLRVLQLENHLKTIEK